MNEETKSSDLEDLEKKFPGVDLAYPIAMESYKVARERFDLMEKRGQTLIVFVTTLGLAIVAFGGKKSLPPPVSVSLVIAFLSYIVSIGCALGSQIYGKVIIPDPQLLREKSLTWDDWTFKNNMIDWAGKNYIEMMKNVGMRAKMINGTLVFGLVSLLSLAIWVS